MIKELENKIGQLQYEISLLGHSEEDLTGVTIRTDELKDLVENLSIHGVSDSFFCDAKLVNGISNCKKQCEGCLKCLHTPKK